MLNPLKKFLHFQPLPVAATRRQLLLSSLGLAFSVWGSRVAQAQQTTSAPKPTTRKPAGTKSARARKIVMIDPGHGGIDSGAIGHGGSKEKQVVLEIARYVRQYLAQNANIDVKLTRDADHFIPLYQRVDLAHQHQADLFISIHADGFTNATVSGASVFALSNRGASSAMASYLSEKENDADKVAGGNYAAQDKNHLKQVLFDLVQTDTIKNSLTLGQHLLSKIKPIHHLHSKNTEQAAFAVLKSPSIPSVLIETSFITNRQEEKLLGTTRFRQQIAQAIAEGIINFFRYFDAHRH